MKLVICALALLYITACTSDSGNSVDNIKQANKEGFTTASKAESVSPIQHVCEQVVRIPLSRGQGGGLEGKYREEVRYFPGYLRGDVNNDGQITTADAKMATSQLFKLDNVVCEATADIAGYPDVIGQPDGAVTSIDITQFNEYRKTGQISWPQEVICSYDCDVHNDPPGSY